MRVVLKSFTFQFLLYLYKAKKIISEVLKKIDYEINRYADILNINKGLRKACKYSGAILFFLFITDIHRYGAWYTDNAVFYKYEWFVLVIIVLWVPFIIVLMIHIFRYIENKHNVILDIIAATVTSYFVWFLILSFYLLPDDKDWLNKGRGYLTIRDVDETFWVVILLPLFFTVIFSLRTFYGWILNHRVSTPIKTKDKAINVVNYNIRYCPNCLNKKQQMLKFTSSTGDEKFWCDACGLIID